MFKNLTILVLLCLSFLRSYPQQTMADYIGEWEGKTANKEALNLDISIKKLGAEKAVFTLSNNKEIISKNFKFGNRINLKLDDDLIFNGIVNDKQSEINGFIKLKGDLHSAKLYKKGEHFEGKWNLSVFHYLQSQSLRLTIKDGGGSDDEYKAYPILGGLWCDNFKKKNNSISFTDNKTGLHFEGQLKPSEIVLNISLVENFITKTSFKKIVKDKKITSVNENSQINDGWDLSKNQLVLEKMEEGIRNDSLVGIEGVLIAKNGKIIYENYFAGFNVNIPHITRSASKSISSAIIGIAIDDKIIEGVDEKLYDFIPKAYQYTKDSLKAKIQLKDLLTMSSGLDVNNKAYEGYYQEESDNNWLQTVLEASMVHKPGTYADYGSANPFLLGIYLSERLDVPLEFYMADKLFSPLGITNYILNTDDTKETPYFGGGFRLTPRDMLKFGQLYLNGGIWKGKQIISEYWVEESFKKHVELQDRNKNAYGYLWWHGTHTINGKIIKSFEARGAGGQLIFVIPELESVVVITAGNYRNGEWRQSGKLFEEYILPAIKN